MCEREGEVVCVWECERDGKQNKKEAKKNRKNTKTMNQENVGPEMLRNKYEKYMNYHKKL